MTEESLKETIKCIHTEWYGDWFETPEGALKMHRHMEVLFNFAGITSTLVENNPGAVTPEQFKKMTGISEEIR